MGSVKLIFRKTKVNKEGRSPVYIRLIKDRKAEFMSTGIHLLTAEWDEKNLKVKSKHPNSARMNGIIAQKLAEAEDALLSLTSKDRNVTVSKVKEKLVGKSFGSFTHFASEFRDKILKQGKIGTYKGVKTSLSKLADYTKNRDLQFEEIDVDFIKSYERYLKSELGNGINTVHRTIKILRKLFNDAHREGIIGPEHNPFLRYKLKTEKITKVYLSEEEIKAIEDLELKADSKKSHHRDIFVFACYAGGMRVSDILSLKWRDFNGTQISMVTQKTTDHVTIKLPIKALNIVLKFKRDHCEGHHYIFPFLKSGYDYPPFELYNNISSCTAYLNKDLKEIAKEAGIEKHISMHTSRHSWATRALRKGMRIEYVSALMGHASIKTTQIYAKIVNTELDKAMGVFDE